MPSYTVTVATGSQWFAGTDDYVYLTLQGTDGCSERHLLDKPFYTDFERGAYDWCSWIPNAPPTMRCPPPTEKGTVTIEQIVETLPDRGRSCWHLGAVWALSQFQDKELFLGMYPDEHFVEKPVKEAMAKFRKNLDEIVSAITERNKNKKLPYYYLSPDRIPNSVAV